MEEFLQFTETSEFKFEYWDGDLVPVAATTQAHAEIADNIHAVLKAHFKPKGCKSFQESVFLRNKGKNTLFLPDILITCNPDDFSGSSRFVDNLSIIVEVLSESTELNDRSYKWQEYRQIPSLKYYLLVNQHNPQVEVYGRPHAQSLFYYESFEGLEAIVHLREIQVQVSMKDIYDGIDFEPADTIS
jgi:Uma2 family endonuclease